MTSTRRLSRRTGMRLTVAVVTVFAMLALPMTAQAGSRPAGTNIANQLTDASQAAMAAEAKARRAFNSLKSVKASLKRAQTNLKSANSRLSAASIRARAARSGQRAAQAALASTLHDLAANQAQIAATRLRVGQVARELYIDGTVSSVDILLSSNSPADYEEQTTSLSAYSSSQTRAINDLQHQRAQLAVLKKRAAEARTAMARQSRIANHSYNEAKRAANDARNATNSIKRARTRVSAILLTASHERTRLMRQMRALQKEAARLGAIDRQHAGSYTGPMPTGELIWPTHGGAVTEGAGPRIHPIWHTKGCHTGIDIGQPFGADVMAAADGVAYRESSVPYGNVIVVVHGGMLSTMYAHLSKYNITSGQHVKTGQVIGFVGSTGWSTGPHLHFEVHINGVPWDPMGWFGKAKRPVNC